MDDGKTPVVKAVIDNGEQHFDSSESERDTLLQKLTAESNEMKSKLDNVLEFMEKFAGATPFSPVRKAARITFHDGDESPAMSMFDAPSIRREHLLTNADEGKRVSYSDKVKVNIKSSETWSSSGILKSLHEAKSALPNFTGKKNHNGSIDVLFKSFDDANKAKAIIDSNLKGAVVDSPAPAKLTRYNLVGIPFAWVKKNFWVLKNPSSVIFCVKTQKVFRFV